MVAKQGGLMGRRVRVLDSTPIYDSVATQDTGREERATAMDRRQPQHDARAWESTRAATTNSSRRARLAWARPLRPPGSGARPDRGLWQGVVIALDRRRHE